MDHARTVHLVFLRLETKVDALPLEHGFAPGDPVSVGVGSEEPHLIRTPPQRTSPTHRLPCPDSVPTPPAEARPPQHRRPPPAPPRTTKHTRHLAPAVVLLHGVGRGQRRMRVRQRRLAGTNGLGLH